MPKTASRIISIIRMMTTRSVTSFYALIYYLKIAPVHMSLLFVVFITLALINLVFQRAIFVLIGKYLQRTIGCIVYN